LGQLTQGGILLQKVGPCRVVEAFGHDLAQTVIPLHILHVLFLHRRGHRHQLKLDLQSLFDTIREEAQDVLAHATSDHSLGVFSRGIWGGGSRGEDPGEHALADERRLILGKVVCVYGVVVTQFGT
jgi:hypothetical protein